MKHQSLRIVCGGAGLFVCVGSCAAGSVSLVPVPGPIDTEFVYTSVALPDFLSPDGGLVGEQLVGTGTGTVWSSGAGAMTIEPPAGFDWVNIHTLLSGDGALLDIRTNDGTQRRHALWAPDQPMEFLDESFPGLSLDPQDWLFDASADRSVAVGAHLSTPDPFEGNAMIWRRGAASSDVPPLEGYARGCFAFASDDGMVAAGVVRRGTTC